MAFGQSPGPSATSQQMRQLTELITEAGHTDFRDARGPLGLNQRQAGGKFTRDEADELITRLEHESETDTSAGPDGPGRGDDAVPPAATAAVGRRQAAQEQSLQKISDELLAAELQRRGWVVMKPD